MPTTRIRGAHRRPRPADEDPAPATGPRRWVVSLGVLGVVGAICGVGAFALGDGGGDSGQAAGLGGSSAAPTPWTARSYASDDASASLPTPAADDEASSDGAAGTGSVDEDGTAAGDGTAATATSGTGSSAGGTASGGWTAGGGTASAGTDGASGTGGTAAGGPGVSAAGGTDALLPTDRAAGVATRTLAQAGTGRLLVVPGSVRAPSAAPSMRVRVEVEEGIGADGQAFAAFVLNTLNDGRSWGHGGTLTFARTDGPADFRVILASPATSARLCAPAQTRGTMSCGGGDKAVLTMYRWMNGIPDYGTDRTAYRHYLVNHEVGHVLGHAHAYCTPGHLAPVMVQQTKGLHGCLPNAWPFP